MFQFNVLLRNDSILKKHGIKNIDFGYFILFGINLGVIILFGVFNSYLESGVIDSGRFDISDFKNGFVIFFIMAVMVFPFFEEFIHRSFVSKRENISWSIIAVMIYFFLLTDFSFHRILVFLSYIFFLLSIFFSSKLYQNKIFLLLFSSLFFAIFHIFKFEDLHSFHLSNLLLSLFPQFFTGFILFFVHSRYGFFAGVLHHGLINGVLLIIIYTTILLFEQEMSASLIAD
ncbi:hypothetical protein [Aquiflexum lacus]|uniref:hypothetical protein n=1 Tax=Aquiflexum lacus TaxID=2483805 RepID=UPI001894F314|nr:hypothetical protein [Aquiflexum lacus]